MASLPGVCLWPCESDEDCIENAEALFFFGKGTLSCLGGLCSECSPGESCSPTQDGTLLSCGLPSNANKSQGTCLGTCDTDKDCRASGTICVEPASP